MVLRVVGKLFIATGVVILLYVGYQLVGTSLIARRHQNALKSALEGEIRASPSPPEDPGPPPDLGDGIALIRIPRIGIEWVVVEGVGFDDLKRGPGHIPGTVFAGRKGNVVISGHRATYGAPFADLDKLAKGDKIELEDRRGVFVYEITGTRIVAPTDLSVIAHRDRPVLTLTTCHPRFSVAQRLIVSADLEKSVLRSKAA